MNRVQRFGPGIAHAMPAPLPFDGPLPRTALPVFRGVPRHLKAHLSRLAGGAAILGESADWLPGLWVEIESWLDSTVPGEDAALRMILHPGTGLLSARLEPLPAAPQPCRLAVMPHPLGDRRLDPSLVHKGLSGPWGAEILMAAEQLGAEDALLLWPDGTLAETAIAALGVEMDGVLTLPPPQGRVASLAERLDLPDWAESKGLRVETGDIPLERAREGQVWCLNALRGLWSATLL